MQAAEAHLPHALAVQGGLKRHQYQVVGRHLPTEAVPEPTLFRMKLWAPNEVSAKSKFWCASVQHLRHLWHTFDTLRESVADPNRPANVVCTAVSEIHAACLCGEVSGA